MNVINGTKWKNPVALAILNQFDFEKSIIDILEDESDQIVQDYCSTFVSDSPTTPIEALANKHGISEVKVIAKHESGAFLRKKDNKYTVLVEKTHYFTQRFFIAHELSHILLRRLAGPLSERDISRTQEFNHEEELLCDIFAACLLVPKSMLSKTMKYEKELNATIVDKAANNFKVSRKLLLNRVAQRSDKIVLFWDKISNPLNSESALELRVKDVYPNKTQLAKFFIPRYCSASNERFNPNLIQKSYELGESNSGKLQINDLGNLPPGEYSVENIFFRYWDPGLRLADIESFRKHFYSLVTFIDITRYCASSSLNFAGSKQGALSS